MPINIVAKRSNVPPVNWLGKILGCLGIGIAGTLIFGLAMCRGPYLGTYRFENARLVDSAALAAIDRERPSTGANASLIRIEFTSDQDVEAAAGDDQLYVHADFCPGHDEYRLHVIGPYYNDRSRYGRTRSIERTLPDGRKQVAVVPIDDPRPSRDPRTNRYVYTAYVVPTQPATQFSGPYDLRSETRDLCLWIDHPGYYLTRSQSDVFVIPGAAIAAALRGQPTNPR